MLQIAVCDDEKLYLNEVLKILHETLDGTPNKIQTFQNSAALIAAVEEDGYIPDIAVLDICMDGVDGITLAKQLNKASPTSKIIFISSYSGYLMDVYETEHVYFVLKGVVANDFDVFVISMSNFCNCGNIGYLEIWVCRSFKVDAAGVGLEMSLDSVKV